MRFKTVSNGKTVFRDSSPPINVTGWVKPSGAPMLSVDCNREVHEIVIVFFFSPLFFKKENLHPRSVWGARAVESHSQAAPKMAAVRSTAASLREKIRRGECEGSSNASRIPANDGRGVVRWAGEFYSAVTGSLLRTRRLGKSGRCARKCPSSDIRVPPCTGTVNSP